MKKFTGFTREHFISIGIDEEVEVLYVKDKDTIKSDFEQFSNDVLEYLNENDKENREWDCHIYDMQKTRIYNHFYFNQNNPLHLNINTMLLLGEGLGVRVWLPLGGGSEGNKEEGKINQKALKETFNGLRKRNKYQELAKVFYRLFEEIKRTCSLSLQVKQFDHKKDSQSKAQTQQKGLHAEILTIGVGSNQIIDKKTKTYVLDENKEIYDGCKYGELTEFTNADPSLFEIFFETLFEKLDSGNKNLCIMIYKELPILWVESRGKKIIKDIGDIVLEFAKILKFINKLHTRNV